jgi:hypothetical protein
MLINKKHMNPKSTFQIAKQQKHPSVSDKTWWWGWPDLNRRPLPGNSACLSLRVSLRPLQNFVIPEAGQQTRIPESDSTWPFVLVSLSLWFKETIPCQRVFIFPVN